MRQEHRAGEKLFVDYAGRTVAVVDRHTGEQGVAADSELSADEPQHGFGNDLAV